MRLSNGRTRVLMVAASVGALLFATPGTAAAQTPAPQPVIDSAPERIRFAGSAKILGHVEDGTPGMEVSLQQRRSGTDWWTVSTKMTDEEAKVRFTRHDLRKSTRFRLMWTDETSEVTTYSEIHRTAVASRISLKVGPSDAYVGRRVKLRGTLYPAVSGRQVVLQQYVHGSWRKIKRTGVYDGRFHTSFEAHYKGHRKVRVIFAGDAFSRRAITKEPLTIYEPDLATWYGPGLYGNRTACGQRLGTETLGVAHRSLPCGTKVSILYRGRTITVPVIDRGPYSSADWDLTSKTAQRLGFSGKETIGVTR